MTQTFRATFNATAAAIIFAPGKGVARISPFGLFGEKAPFAINVASKANAGKYGMTTTSFRREGDQVVMELPMTEFMQGFYSHFVGKKEFEGCKAPTAAEYLVKAKSDNEKIYHAVLTAGKAKNIVEGAKITIEYPEADAVVEEPQVIDVVPEVVTEKVRYMVADFRSVLPRVMEGEEIGGSEQVTPPELEVGVGVVVKAAKVAAPR